MIPETEIAKMKERVEKATKGPWEFHELAGVPMVWDGSGDAIVNQMGADGRPYLEPDDALFVANSRTDIPALLAERSELLSKIEEQERELVRLREGWVSVKDRLPDDGRGVLCAWESGRFMRLVRTAAYSEDYGWNVFPPTHWQELPAPPRPFTSQEVYEGIPDLVAKAEEMEKQGVPVVDVPKVGE